MQEVINISICYIHTHEARNSKVPKEGAVWMANNIKMVSLQYTF